MKEPTQAQLLRGSQMAHRILNILDEKPHLNAGEMGIVLGTALKCLKDTYQKEHGDQSLTMMKGIFAIMENLVFENANDNLKL